jgi:hypothetical protein
MNVLDRSPIEKAWYDNGFEIVQQSDAYLFRMGSSLHPITADITEGIHQGAYALRFSANLSLTELKRNLNKELFQNGKIEAWNRVFSLIHAL